MKKSSLYLVIVALILDLLAVFIGMFVAYNLRTDGGSLYFWPFQTYLKVVLGSLIVWIITLVSVGLYNPRTLPRGWNSIGRILMAASASWGILLIVLYLIRTPETEALSRLLILYAILSTVIALLVSKLIFSELVGWFYSLNIGTIKTIIIGNDDDIFTRNLKIDRSNGRNVIATLNKNTTVSDLTKYYQNEAFDELVIVKQPDSEDGLVELLNWAENLGISFVMVPSLISLQTSNVDVGTLGGMPTMFIMRSALEGWGRVYKRLFDLIFSVVFMVVLSPIFLILAILVKITSKGPVLFRQERVGQDGKTFYVHKFRSMYADADARFAELGGWSSDEKRDPRITFLGHILRKTNLDELPQLWDIFCGRMSVVGPRPEQPKYVEKFSHELPDYIKRHHVKSGLTGWAQVNGLRGDTSIAERVKYDLYYIQNWSILFDIRIIISTFLIVIKQIFGATQ